MSSPRSCILLVSTLFILGTEASLNLRSAASEELNSLRAFPSTQTIPQSSEPHGKVADVTAASETKILKDLDWWFLARNTIMTVLIAGTLVVGLCVCLKFGEGKQAEHWGNWTGSHEVPRDEEKWANIEIRMQKTDVSSYVEATDYQQLLKNVALKVGREKGAEDTKSGAMRSFFAKTFRLNEMSSAAGAVLQAMPAKEAMHWLQLQPKPFQAGQQ